MSLSPFKGYIFVGYGVHPTSGVVVLQFRRFGSKVVRHVLAAGITDGAPVSFTEIPAMCSIVTKIAEQQAKDGAA